VVEVSEVVDAAPDRIDAGVVGTRGAGAARAVDVDTGQILYSTEGNRLRRVDVDTLDHPPLRQDVLIGNATDGEAGATDARSMLLRSWTRAASRRKSSSRAAPS